ncbi:MAG TPA: caspase family protein [Polyangiales bacterium]|nr:caspase family protein [Polyangiales bacterium]
MLCACLALCCGASSARADVVRFGLFIGNNQGASYELPLRFATSDAQRMQEALVDLGGFSALNAVVLREPDADSARGALIALNDRIRAAATRPDTQVMLFVYYSGHADRRALHLGDSQLSLLELEQLVRGSAAHFRMLLVDACGSGALTRSKGGSPAPGFPVQLGETLDGQGVAFLTSSSASEDAQESDELGGSFFTHHFISGLMGAADNNRDDRIDLEEAYRYAYESTLRSTSRTWAGTQHPTFRFELNGNASAVLSEPRKSGKRAQLVFPAGRDYLVLREGASGSVVAEVVAGARTRRISVRPDRYFLRGRASAYVLEGELEVGGGETRVVEDALLERVEYARLVRKGGSAVASSGGPLVGYSLRGPLSSGAGPCHGLFAGYAFAWPELTLTPRLDACTGGFENARVRAAFYELGGDLRVAHVWDFPAFSVDIGFAVGASWLRQSFVTSGRAPVRDSLALRTSVGPTATFELGSGLYFTTDLAAETYAFHLQDTATREAAIAAALAFRARAGFGKQW